RDQLSMDAWGRGEDRADGWTGGHGAGNPPARVPCDICCIVLYDGACLLAGVYSSRVPAGDLRPPGADALVDDRRALRLPRIRHRGSGPGPGCDRGAANSLLPPHFLRQSGSLQEGHEKPGVDAGNGMADSTAVQAAPDSPSAWLRGCSTADSGR